MVSLKKARAMNSNARRAVGMVLYLTTTATTKTSYTQDSRIELAADIRAHIQE
jgi:hypothetical protein